MPEKEPDYCTYATVKLDDELLFDAKAVASMNRKSVQEWLSDLVNDVASKALGKKPVKRRAPRPRHKRHRE